MKMMEGGTRYLNRPANCTDCAEDVGGDGDIHCESLETARTEGKELGRAVVGTWIYRNSLADLGDVVQERLLPHSTWRCGSSHVIFPKAA